VKAKLMQENVIIPVGVIGFLGSIFFLSVTFPQLPIWLELHEPLISQLMLITAITVSMLVLIGYFVYKLKTKPADISATGVIVGIISNVWQEAKKDASDFLAGLKEDYHDLNTKYWLRYWYAEFLASCTIGISLFFALLSMYGVIKIFPYILPSLAELGDWVPVVVFTFGLGFCANILAMAFKETEGEE